MCEKDAQAENYAMCVCVWGAVINSGTARFAVRWPGLLPQCSRESPLDYAKSFLRSPFPFFHSLVHSAGTLSLFFYARFHNRQCIVCFSFLHARFFPSARALCYCAAVVTFSFSFLFRSVSASSLFPVSFGWFLFLHRTWTADSRLYS